MKKFLYLSAALLTAAVISGCSSVSPYDYGSNWLIRENDIPRFYSKFDLFYIGKAPADYGNTHDIQFNWAKTHTNDIFGRGVRVFAPEIENFNVKNIAAALEYYLENFHADGHPFILLAEGKDADLLYAAMQEVDELTVENGFIAAYLPDMQSKTAAQIAEDFSGEEIKAATDAGSFGVIITWKSCINDEKIPPAAENAYNINPLNWKTDSTPAARSENIKAVFYMPEHKNMFWRKVEEKNFCSAVIDPANGVLKINCPVPLLHFIDGKFTNNCISIFAGNIAANARLRSENLIKYREWKNLK